MLLLSTAGANSNNSRHGVLRAGRFPGLRLLARLHPEDGEDRWHAGQGHQQNGEVGRKVVQEAPPEERLLHRPAEGRLAHWILHAGIVVVRTVV